MDVLETILPVLVLLLIGVFCRRTGMLSRAGVDNIKSFVTKVILPVAIFHALATATFTRMTITVVIIMFVMLVVSFSLGHLMRPLVPGAYSKYIPYMVSVYEGGMMGYPLFTSLVGMEHLSRIAIVDMAGLLFGFSVYMGMLGQVENNEPIQAKKLIMSAFHTPTFIATVLGILAGLSGGITALLASPAGDTYLAVKDMITAPLNTMILVVVGYDIALNNKMIKPCLKTIGLRAALQAVMIACVLFAVHRFVGTDRILDLAVICYMSSPATFSMQTYVKDKDGSAYVSTANSLYCLVSIGVYILLAIFI